MPCNVSWEVFKAIVLESALSHVGKTVWEVIGNWIQVIINTYLREREMALKEALVCSLLKKITPNFHFLEAVSRGTFG